MDAWYVVSHRRPAHHRPGTLVVASDIAWVYRTVINHLAHHHTWPKAVSAPHESIALSLLWAAIGGVEIQPLPVWRLRLAQATWRASGSRPKNVRRYGGVGPSRTGRVGISVRRDGCGHLIVRSCRSRVRSVALRCGDEKEMANASSII